FDKGTITQMSSSLSHLAEQSQLRINQYDFERLGIKEGAQVEVTSEGRNISISVKVDNRVPRSSALIYSNLDGADPRELLIEGTHSIDIRIDPTSKARS
ncbi:MAG: molybdopterin dinucleotide binding domain-containing protein, partial [Acidimicrobiales bacterium]